MSKDTEKTDRYFRMRFEHFEQEPPEKAWKNIAARLGHDRKKNMVLFIVRIAAGMALIISLGIGYQLLKGPGNQPETAKLATHLKDVTPADTLKERPATSEKSTVTPERKTERSNRFERVRKKYKGPEVSESPSRNEARMLPSGTADRNQDPQITANGQLAMIRHPVHQGMISKEMPVTLFRYPVSASTQMTIEETTALLLSGNESDAGQTVVKEGRWTLGGEVAPLYSYRTITSDYLEPSMISSLNNAENGIIAYAGGIRVGFTAARRLSVQSGIYYSRYGQEKSNIETYSFSNTETSGTMGDIGYYISIPNSTGSIQSSNPGNFINDKAVPGSIRTDSDVSYFANLNGLNYTDLVPMANEDVSIAQYFDYLELPLILKYKIIDRKFGFSLTGGLVTNFLVSNVVSLEQNGEKSTFGRTGNINEINYLGSLGLGMEYPVAQGLAFSLEPRFRYYLNPLDRSSQINVHPYSFGIFAGLSYKF